MEKLQKIEIKGIRVLTTKQLADAYKTSADYIKNNFQYNKNRYIEGKHYITLKGDELRTLKRENEIYSLFKQAKCVHVWTEKGALLHAKSINTDKAWDVYEYLVDHYFRAEEIMRQQSYGSFARQQASEGQQVVDVPDNVKIQESIHKSQKQLTAVEVMLEGLNKYRSEEEYKEYCKQIQIMGMIFYNQLYETTSIQPKLVKKDL